MRQRDIKESFDKIEPNEAATRKMLNRILTHPDHNSMIKRKFNYRKALPVCAAVVLLVGSLFVYSRYNSNDKPLTEIDHGNSENSRAATEDMISSENADLAVLKDQFQIDNRHYSILSDDQKTEFGFKNAVSQSDIGDKIAVIRTSVDQSLIGCEVYRYSPAAGEEVVAVKKGSEFRLFGFYGFESYIKNQDEDANTYLKLYGIHSAGDISKIRFITWSNQPGDKGAVKGEIVQKTGIEKFYNYYSVIKDSSKQYFDKLYSYKENTANQGSIPSSGSVPPDYQTGIGSDTPVGSPETAIAADGVLTAGAGACDPAAPAGYDTGSSGNASSRAATNALENSVTIRIYNQKGIYYETVYYPNLGFISRHEVNAEFAAFLKGYIN